MYFCTSKLNRERVKKGDIYLLFVFSLTYKMIFIDSFLEDLDVF